MDLQGKFAVVTGGSRGIGRAVVLELARRGAFVDFTWAGNEKAALETASAAEAAGGRVKAWQLDVKDTAACQRVVDQVFEAHGRIDILVNNAGIALDGLIMRYPDEDWDKVMDTNLRGTFAMMRAVSRPMMKQRSGAIVNLTSVSGEMGNSGQTVYSASKAGIIGMTKSMARELAARHVRVNAVSPGFIETDMTSVVPEEVKQMIPRLIPAGRMGRSEEVAAAVAFLASDAASYITGEVLKVNGGLYM